MSIGKPSRLVFWLSFIIGVFAVVNEYITDIDIPIISEFGNLPLLAVAFLLLLAGVIFKKL